MNREYKVWGTIEERKWDDDSEEFIDFKETQVCLAKFKTPEEARDCLNQLEKEYESTKTEP